MFTALKEPFGNVMMTRKEGNTFNHNLKLYYPAVFFEIISILVGL